LGDYKKMWISKKVWNIRSKDGFIYV